MNQPHPPQRPCVVIPALNEAASVAQVIRDVRTVVPDLDIVVIDDGSHDDTATVARAAGVLVLQLPFTLGVGAARRLGFKYALRHGYDAVIQVDGDGQHVPKYIPKMLTMLDSADLVIGARFAGEDSYQVDGLRRPVMRWFARHMSKRSGETLTDTTSGYRATGYRALCLYAEHYPMDYLGDTVESLAVTIHRQLVVKQLAVQMRPREHGRPSQNFVQSVFSVYRTLLAIVLANSRIMPTGSKNQPKLPLPRKGSSHKEVSS